MNSVAIRPLYLANQPLHTEQHLDVRDKYTDQLVAWVCLADRTLIDRAMAESVQSASVVRSIPPYERQAILLHCVRRFQERSEELAQLLCSEVGKPIRDARGEVTRLIDTFRQAAEEATRIGGEVINLEISPRSRGYRGWYQRVPIGPCAMITPFNFPLNLAAHKIAPAIAAGCPFILKPSSLTPISTLILGEILAETSLPDGTFSILPCSPDNASIIARDDRMKLLSFTGSATVGWHLKSIAGKKKVTLELGGNAACVVDADADLDDAVQRLVFGAFYQSGQSCIGVQRILIHEAIYDSLKQRLIEETRKLPTGDPCEESTWIGPMISQHEAERLEGWIHDAVAAGGTLLCGGERVGAVLSATLLENVPSSATICRQEAFGPVAVLSRFRDFSAALAEVNDSPFGLQAGIFTRDWYKAQLAWDTLEVGTVVVGDVPSWRGDNMPYGGVKESGIGREGVRYAIDSMTEIRGLVIRTP